MSITKLDFNNQIRPVEADSYDKYMIQDLNELIEQLESLKYESKLMINTRMDDIEVFYRDYNALSIAIEILSHERMIEDGYKGR